MHYRSFLFTIFLTICCINIASAGPAGVDCHCTCCFSSQGRDCTPTDIGSVHLNLSICDQNQCFKNCDSNYPNCAQDWHGKLNVTCSDTIQSSTSTTSAPSSSTTSTSETRSTPTNTSPRTSSPTNTTTGSATPTAITTSGGSASTTPHSSASAIKSVFRLSYFILFTILLIFI